MKRNQIKNNQTYTIAVDVMGFENDISCAINACYDFALKNNIKIILVGNESLISKNLKKSSDLISIEHANDIVEQNDTILSIRKKNDTSMKKAIELVKQNKADGVLSAGNSAIYVFLTYQIFGLIEGIKKPGFMSYVPTFNNQGFNILDVGASPEVDGNDLYKFALMANIYISSRNVNNPKIGLLNIGTEAHKGFEFHHQANELLKNNKKLNYVGFIESKNLLDGIVDIVVTDGYGGNICLKSMEGTAKLIFSNIIKYYKKWWRKPLFLFSASMLLNMKKKFDYKNNAGAFVLGLNHIAVKTHGSADYKQFYSSLRMLKEVLDHDILNKIKKEIKNEL